MDYNESASMKNRTILIIYLIVYVTLAYSQGTPNLEEDTTISEKVNILSFIDNRDNTPYSYIDIDGTYWMTENLIFKSENSLIYNHDVNNETVFGRLYSWKEATCACPDAWRLPTEEDWKKLELHIGLNQEEINLTGWRGTNQADALKDKKNNTWLSKMHLTSSDVGFNAPAGGVAYSKNSFANIGLGGYYWSATSYYSSFAWSRYVSYNKGSFYRNISAVNWYFSVRCVQDRK